VSNKNLFFKPNVIAEPLFNQWYAWPYLIPPASAAMYLANAHLKIMQSFVAAPQVHIAALKNPAMLGGPFISYDATKVPAIKALIGKTTAENAHLLAFAEAIKALDNMLLAEATGFSMESLYQKVPEILKGYVELVYDLQDNPSIRFIEGMLYKSKFYQLSAQSIALSEVNSDCREFVFSTPRLDGGDFVNLNIPFNSEALDKLFSMRSAPNSFDDITDALGVPSHYEQQFASLFTEQPPEERAEFDGDGVRVRYLGHACLLVETKEVSLLFDPVVSYEYGGEVERYTFTDLPETIDYVLLTHTHQDHVMFETLIQLRHKIKNIIVPKSSGGGLVDPSLKLILQSIGFRNVWEMDELEQVELPGGHVMGCPFLGEHADLNVRTKLAYYVNLHGNKIMMAADSNNLESRLYMHLHELVNDIDLLFIGMECDGAPMSWLYGPLLTKPISRKNDQSRRFDGSTYDKAISIVEQMKPGAVYVYAMGQEPWCSFLTSIQYTEQSRPIVESTKLVNACLERGINSERLFGRKEILLPSKATPDGRP
jgi:L-ascorbate metabolism protein UlaG (beta-lactamase superfamily)